MFTNNKIPEGVRGHDLGLGWNPLPPKTDFKVYKRKIDLYAAKRVDGEIKGWVYLCTTNAAKTCKQAVDNYCKAFGISAKHLIKGRFQ
jgi:hypothetical protein